MAPSVAETVSHTTDQIQEKLAAITVSEPKPETKPEEAAAPAVQEPSAEAEKEEPKLQTNHKEPLKLSGALDHFESFDVTPTIGREFIGVNLAKWLKASNSDDIIRDLAITSKYFLGF
jgi:hypothetical protein